MDFYQMFHSHDTLLSLFLVYELTLITFGLENYVAAIVQSLCLVIDSESILLEQGKLIALLLFQILNVNL